MASRGGGRKKRDPGDGAPGRRSRPGRDGQGDGGRAAWTWPLALVVITVGVFANTIGSHLVWTDLVQVGRGTRIWTSWAKARAVLVAPDDLNFYRPVYDASLTLDHALWGERWAGYHLGNVVLHAAFTVVVFWLALEILSLRARAMAQPHSGGAGSGEARPARGTAEGVPGEEAPGEGVDPAAPATRAQRWTAGLVALVWALHPTKSETVAWIADRTDLLMMPAFLAMVVALRGVAKPLSWSRGLMVSGCLGLSLLAKETSLVVAPLLLWTVVTSAPARAYATADGGRRALWRGGVVWLPAGVVAVYLVVRRVFLWAPPDLGGHHDLGARLGNQAVTIWQYLRVLVAPWTTSASDVVTMRGPGDVAVVASVALWSLVLAAVVWAAVRAARAGRPTPWSVWAVGWFVIALAPMSNVVEQMHFRADRYLFIASLGPILALGAWLAAWTAGRAASGHRASPAFGRGVAMAVVVVLAVLTVRRNDAFDDDESFFAGEVARAPLFREGLLHLCERAAERDDVERAAAMCARGIAVDRRRHAASVRSDVSFYVPWLWVTGRQPPSVAGRDLARQALAAFPDDANVRRLARVMVER